jgi:hypothetical protein
LTQAIQNGETWYIKDATVLTLNYAFIEMVMNAYSSLPIAEYRIRNGGERGQQLAVTTSHESVVAFLTYKASMNSHAKPKQTHVANVYQLNNYGSQKKIIEDNFPVFFPHHTGASCNRGDVAAWCCNIKWVAHYFNRRRGQNSTSAFESDCPHKYYLALLGFFDE